MTHKVWHRWANKDKGFNPCDNGNQWAFSLASIFTNWEAEIAIKTLFRNLLEEPHLSNSANTVIKV